MNWIKKNPAQFSLALIAVVLLFCAFMVFSRASAFAETVKANVSASPRPPKFPNPEVKTIDDARGSIGKPGQWQTNRDTQGSLLVSEAYVLVGDRLVKPYAGSFNPPVPNKWLFDEGFDATIPSVLDEDPDHDGFSNLLEWLGMDHLPHLQAQAGTSPVVLIPVMGADGKPLPEDSTKPNDPKSHPPYFTRLEIAEIVSVPFRLRFMSADVGRNPKDVTVGINRVDSKKTDFISLNPDDVTDPAKLGVIPGTTYKVESFTPKEEPGPDGVPVDKSFLTVINNATGDRIILPKDKIINSPESYGVLRYLWVAPGGQPTKEMNLRKGQTFKLPPENEKEYKVTEIKPLTDANGKVTSGEITVLLPTGQPLVLKFPAPK